MNPSVQDLAAQAAARLNLMRGHDGAWRGRCPSCGYAKPSLTMRLASGHIEISCQACGRTGAIAAIMGLPPDLVTAPRPSAAKMARAIEMWSRAAPAPGSIAEQYLRGRGITIAVPPSIRYLSRQKNWADGRFYPAMISLVERVPGEDDEADGARVPAGTHLTFLEGPDTSGRVCKAKTDSNKLTLGQLRHGGVWLAPAHEVGLDLAVAEGIETALSVQQLTGLPTVAALSAAVMRTIRWPSQVRRLWIAADNDEPGRLAAKALLKRAIAAGLEASIKVPAFGMNDFNDLFQREH